MGHQGHEPPMRFQNSPKSAFPLTVINKLYAFLMVYIATPEDLNFPKFSERKELSAGHATAMN